MTDRSSKSKRMSRTKTVDALPPAASIAAVERETGISKDTLRVWERRYGFPVPSRDQNGDRVYSAQQVAKLRVIRRLLDQGGRPAKLVNVPLTELTERLSRATRKRGALTEVLAVTPEVSQLSNGALRLIKANAAAALRQQLAKALLLLGSRRFAIELAGPLNRQVGEAWACGDITISQEHLYTEQMQHLLRQTISSLSSDGQGGPRVLLTTLPGEEHQLGLLMAHVCLAADGAHCLSLGAQTPASDIAQAAREYKVDVAGLSFSETVKIHSAYEMLADLRARVDAGIEIWAGGSIWQRARKQIEGVTLIASLDQIPEAIARHSTPSRA